MAADITTSADRFAFETPRVELEYAGAAVANVSFATFDNGGRFIVPDPLKRPNSPLTALLHWQDELW